MSPRELCPMGSLRGRHEGWQSCDYNLCCHGSTLSASQGSHSNVCQRTGWGYGIPQQCQRMGVGVWYPAAVCVCQRTGVGGGVFPQQLVCKYFGFHLLRWDSSSGVIRVSHALTISLFAAEYCPPPLGERRALPWTTTEP